MIVQDLKEWGDIRYIYNSIMISDLLVGPKYHTCIVYSWLIPVRPLGSIGPQPLLARRLFLATFFNWAQVNPTSSAPDSTDVLQVCLDLPTFRFPWGFQSSACLVMFSMVYGECDLSIPIFSSLFLFRWVLGWYRM